eukprot:3922601-Alexandrium_andersonii.AAC.1
MESKQTSTDSSEDSTRNTRDSNLEQPGSAGGGASMSLGRWPRPPGQRAARAPAGAPGRP